MTNALTVVLHLVLILIAFLVFYFVEQSLKKFAYDFRISDLIVQNNMWLMLSILGVGGMVIKSNQFINAAGFMAILSGATRMLMELDQFLHRRMYKGVVEKAIERFDLENDTKKGKKHDS